MKSAVLCALTLAGLALAGKSALPPKYKIARSPSNGDPSISIHQEHHRAKRQVPAEATGLKKIKSPNGYSVRYKELTGKGVCELNKHVRSFSGYVDLSDVQHVFFMFFASRNSPAKDPLTLWLNGPSALAQASASLTRSQAARAVTA